MLKDVIVTFQLKIFIIFSQNFVLLLSYSRFSQRAHSSFV